MKLRNLSWCLVLCAGVASCAVTEPAEPPPVEVSPDGTITTAPTEPRPVEARVLAELALPNRNTVTFFQLADGGLVVREHGEPRTNAIGTIPELADASPYELFLAVAPAGTQPPAELVADQAAVVARRARDSAAGAMPDGFRVDALPGFYAASPARAFNSCTDVSAWEDSEGSAPVGANCPSSGTFAYVQCTANWSPPHVDSCDGTSCTEYFLSGYHKTRSSVCARAGDGYIRFLMGIRDHGGSFSGWFDHTLSTGGYYYYWYSHSSQEKDFWRLIYRTGARTANKSWWLKS
jgi:hypothetical protein